MDEDVTGGKKGEGGHLTPFNRFLKARFKRNKTDLCLYMLNASQSTDRKFSASFFRRNTYDQLADFAADMYDSKGGENAESELESL